MFKQSQPLVALAAATVLLAFQALARADIELPRYHLATGQELDYQGQAKAEHQDHPQLDITDTTLKIWVVRENPDKSLHLIVQSSVKNGAPQKKDVKAGGENPPVTTVAQVDLSADGDTPETPAAAGQVTPEVFPPLPKNLNALTGWENTDEDTGQKTIFKPLRQRDRNEFLFAGTHAAITDAIYQTASNATFHFDWSKGLISRIETQFSQGYGTNVRGTGAIDLQQVVAADPDFIKQLSAESDVYFAASAAASQAVDAATLDPAQTESKLAEADKLLKDAAAKITLPLLKEQLDAQIKAQPEAAKFVRDTAKHRAELLAAPPLAWATTDLAGQPVTAEGLRGKVAILYFWSRDIPWCISEMPAVNQLQTDFRTAPVMVLGLNTGDDPRDAQAVAQQMQLAYPQVKGEALANQLKINELPTVLVLDQTGKIREIYTGFAPKLHEQVAKTIKDLLAQK